MTDSSGDGGTECWCDQCDNKDVACTFSQDRKCSFIPLEWGRYCAYEKQFIQQRHKDLVSIYNDMRRLDRERKNGQCYLLNRTILYGVCATYANDLKPVRLFHNSERGISPIRRAAFLARLIANHRPIALTQELSKEQSLGKGLNSPMKINERFALFALCHFLTIPVELIGKLPVFRKVAEELMFIFTHRDPQPESLVCIARLLDDAMKVYHQREQEKRELHQNLERLENRYAKLKSENQQQKEELIRLRRLLSQQN